MDGCMDVVYPTASVLQPRPHWGKSSKRKREQETELGGACTINVSGLNRKCGYLFFIIGEGRRHERQLALSRISKPSVRGNILTHMKDTNDTDSKHPREEFGEFERGARVAGV